MTKIFVQIDCITMKAAIRQMGGVSPGLSS